jgi:hypothetical protein
MSSTAAIARASPGAVASPLSHIAGGAQSESRVAVLLVDVERVIAPVDERIYGHFLEHINHSVVDGLFAEQIRGCWFEEKDFETYWEPFSDRGSVENAGIDFRNGKKSVRLNPEGGRAGIRQGRVYVAAGQKYDGSLLDGQIGNTFCRRGSAPRGNRPGTPYTGPGTPKAPVPALTSARIAAHLSISERVDEATWLRNARSSSVTMRRTICSNERNGDNSSTWIARHC